MGKLEAGDMAAELAVIEGIEAIAQQFEAMSDRYLREKAQDFRDIGERLLHELIKHSTGSKAAAEPREG